jgi:transposase
VSRSPALARSQHVVIAVDPHKASWTAVAVDASLHTVATVRVPVSRVGYRDLRRFARRWPQAEWAIEGAAGLGAPLAAWLREDGITAVDVPAKLAARVRMLSTGHARKSDEADAVSVGIAALSAPGLHRVEVDEAISALRAVVEHRGDLVKHRVQTINRLHALLVRLIPAGAPTHLSADVAAALLRRVRPRDPVQTTLRALAVEMVAEIRYLDRRISTAGAQITTMITAAGSTLTDLYGIGPLLAGTILARVGTITRFRSAAAFACYNGTAPIEVSSGDVLRHRLSRSGDRQLNHALHMMAITQLSGDTTGRAYYRRKRAAGKSHKEALRCLKRRLSDIVYRQLAADATAVAEASLGGHQGATLESSAAS